MISFAWNPFGSNSSTVPQSSPQGPPPAEAIISSATPAPLLSPSQEILPPTPAAPTDSRPFWQQHYLTDYTPLGRARRQLTLFAAGSFFLLLSTRLATRSLHKRYLSIVPPFYTPNNRPVAPFNGGMDAFEALSIASIAVASVGMCTVGGWMWALDVTNVEELRVWVRLRFGGEERKSDKEVEEELEEWVATILARKDDKRKRREVGS